MEVRFNDNYFRSETNKRKVLELRLSAGLESEYKTEKTDLEFNFKLNGYIHSDIDDTPPGASNARDFDYIAPELGLTYAYLLGERFVIGITDEFFLTREPASSDAFANATDRDRYWRNRIRPYVSYDLSERGSILLAYRNELLQFIDTDDPSNQDSLENRGILTLTYNFDETKHLDWDNQLWGRDYDGSSSDYNAFQSRLIYRHEFNENLEGRVGLGWQWREFEANEIDPYSDVSFVARLIARGEATLVYLNLDRNINDFTTANQYYAAYRLTAHAERTFLEKFKAQLGGYYQFSDYIETDREDDLWSIYTGIRYSFWHDQMEAGLTYAHYNRNSNLPGNDYSENQIFLSVGYRFSSIE